jgi:6-phosphogluconolactonase/glucosamine-6-phosphate isomerase/deaminase
MNTLLRTTQKKDVLLLLSGGSARTLAEHIDTSLLGTHITISVLDERWTHEQAHSNFYQLTTTSVWREALDRNVAHIDPRPHEPEDVYDTAKRFDLAIKLWHITHRDGVVIVTMGIGEDGHTAGVLPMPEDRERFKTLFEHTHTCIRGYVVQPEKNPHTTRMTATLTYLRRHVHHTVVYATGEKKQSALTRVCAENGDVAETPARVLHDMHDAQVYTDSDTTTP